MKAVNISCLCFAVIAVLALIAPLFPNHKSARNANCESNLKQIGTALKMYLPDWDDHYPINCAWNAKHGDGPIVSHVRLNLLEKDAKGGLLKFKHGPNWVEALYKYTEEVCPKDDPVSVWRCQNVDLSASARDSDTGVVTYAFNANLAGYSDGKTKEHEHLMIGREMDRLVNAELRPMNCSIADPDAPPVSPFLTTSDRELGKTIPHQHYNGSHILFADGHIKLFSADFFPSDRDITKQNCWDAKGKQWYNYGLGSKGRAKLAVLRSIAITP